MKNLVLIREGMPVQQNIREEGKGGGEKEGERKQQNKTDIETLKERELCVRMCVRLLT